MSETWLTACHHALARALDRFVRLGRSARSTVGLSSVSSGLGTLNMLNILGMLGLIAVCGPETALGANGTRLPAANFVGLRPAGMGHAFTAVADDQNALYYNPAGLARLESWSFELLSPIIGWNSFTMENFDAFKSMGTVVSSGGKSASATIAKLDPLLQQISGENHFIRVGLAPYFVKRNFGFGIYVNNEIDAVPHEQGEPEILDVSILADSDVRFSYARSFLGDKLSLGMTVYGKVRAAAVAEEIGILTILDQTKDSKKAQEYWQDRIGMGWGVGADFGMLFTPVQMWSPTLGLSVLNIGDTKFKSYQPSEKFKSGAPTSVPQAVNMGVSVSPTFGQWVTRAAMDFREVNLPTPASKKPSLGFEGGWKGKYVSALAQTGLSEGYLSAGFEARLLVLTLRYATYKTDRGFFPTQNAERRHLVQVKVLL